MKGYGVIAVASLVCGAGVVWVTLARGDFFPLIVGIVIIVHTIGSLIADSYGYSYWWLCWIPWFQRRYAIVMVKREIKEREKAMFCWTDQGFLDRGKYLEDTLKKLKAAQRRLGVFEKNDFYIPLDFRWDW